MIFSLLQQAVRWKFRAQASQSSPVRHWYKVVCCELTTYGSNYQDQIRNILVRIKNQSEYTSVSESGPHIYAMSIPSRSYKSLGWGSDNHVRMIKRRKPVYTTIWQRIMSIDDLTEIRTSTREPGKWSWWALVPFSPMMAPRMWSELFLAIRGGCRFFFSVQRLSQVWAAFRPSRTTVEFLFEIVAL